MISRKKVQLINYLKLWIIVCTMILISGCSVIHIYQTGGTAGREQGNQPATEWKSKTVHTLLWGAIRHDVVVENCALGNGQRINIEEVKVEKKFPHMLASIITIGLWEPSTISWRCAKPPVTTGTLN